MLATAAVGATGTALSSVVSHVIIRILNGSFNPNYKNEDRRKMLYIQRKYSQAYQGDGSGEEPAAVIASIDPSSRILMTTDRTKPANPFQDEAQFEESMMMNFHPVSGHQGRFVGSHAMACIGVINDYQLQRRWVQRGTENEACTCATLCLPTLSPQPLPALSPLCSL
ncbi:hypothetical protein B484DRAFT_247398 [Ochromonadaceae sp. CCMP2298]|nr:hypothetical protein B484DRAFT_247398 [Ochromonadaceae sp. CCMP2298]